MKNINLPRIFIATVVVLTTSMVPRVVSAQEPGGSGHQPDDSGLHQEPKSTLPDPSGWASGVDWAEMKEAAGEVMFNVGGVEMAAGGLLTAFGFAAGAATAESGIGAVAGTQIASFGFGLSLAGAAVAGAGAVVNAVDPPRSNYASADFCRPPSYEELLQLIVSVNGEDIEKANRELVESAGKLLVHAANLLAAKEYHEGAALKSDEPWMIVHRENYVAEWNAMRQSLIDISDLLEDNGLTEALHEANIPLDALDKYYKSNKEAVKMDIRQKRAVLFEGLESQCPDLTWIMGQIPNIRLNAPPSREFKEMPSQIKQFQSVVQDIPVLE